MRRLPEERRKEPVERPRDPAGRERRDPGCDGRERSGYRPEREPAEVWHDEQWPEGDDEPRPAEVAIEAECDRVCRAWLHGRIVRRDRV